MESSSSVSKALMLKEETEKQLRSEIMYQQKIILTLTQKLKENARLIIREIVKDLQKSKGNAKAELAVEMTKQSLEQEFSAERVKYEE